MTITTHLPPIVLASGSPRRKELLSSLGLDFVVQKAGIDEEAEDVSGKSPAEVVMHLATLKAMDVTQTSKKESQGGSTQASSLVIGSDTIVVLDGQIFGKPKDKADAARMLSELQGRTHTVYSGICVIDSQQDKVVCDYLATAVTMKPLEAAAIQQYIETGEPMDKAGAYAIQGYGSLLVAGIEGCYFNVVGMSMFLLNQLLTRLGYSLL